ncbi:hypothetical protein CLOM_g10517 [Closterium sp. NIES-68]|nr:hypothetical protein CLOM_g10517 [Closterium sp. NIES-68]GJP87024.1 hypothetical protein CLOP_g16990 [Closterium sp. NIES-67]
MQEAISIFNQLEGDPEYEERALVGRGTVHFLTGRHQQALADLSQVTSRFPLSADAWQRRGVVLQQMGLLQEALSDINRAVQLQPHEPHHVKQRGKLLFQVKDYRAAVADLSPLQDTPLATADVMRTLGWASAALGAFKAAAQVYGRALERFPQEGALWREKGCSHKELGEAQLARACLEKAVAIERAPENYHKLALLHMHTGKPRQALKVASEGLRLFPHSTALHYLAASAHHALADHAAAAKHYSTVLSTGGQSTEEHAQKHYNLAFYQREVAAYTRTCLTQPLTACNIDAHLHPALLEAWMKLEPPHLLPPSAPRYTAEQHQQQQRQQQQGEVRLSAGAVALVAKADKVGPRAMYRVGGFLHDKRKLRMAGLAALDVMQQASSTWQAMQEDEEEEQDGSVVGSSSGRDGSSSSSSSSTGKVKQQKRRGARIGGWRDVFQAIVRWRQIVDPMDAVSWIQDGKASYGSHVAATPIVDGQMDNYKYFQFYDRAFSLIKDRLLATRSATADSGTSSISLSASSLKKVRRASGLGELHAAVGRDFYVQLPCYSRANPGADIGGIQLSLISTPPGFVFAIRIGLSPQRWRDFKAEMDAAWKSLCTAVVEARRAQGSAQGSGTASDSHTQHAHRQRVQRAILDLAFFWYHLSPLSRGSAMVGLISMLGLSMAAGMETTALVPEGMQVDWEAMLVPDSAAFNATIAPWLFSSVQQPSWDLPNVHDALPTTQHVLAALNM